MKRIFSLFMTLALVVTLFSGVLATNALTPTYSDVPTTHWAYLYIDYLSYKNVLSGDGNGKFRPEDTVTRAEFIKMMVELFGLKETAYVQYTNIPKWAVSYVEKAAAQGFLLNYSQNADFGKELTREEAVALLMRYLDLGEGGNIQYINLSDYYSIDVMYRDYVVEAISEGIVSGYKDGTFRPKNILTRAEALTILYMAAGAIYDQSAYANSTGAYHTNAVINNSASLYNLDLSGRILITEDVEVVNFIDCDISGNIYVRGDTTVCFKDTNAPYIEFQTYEGELKLKEDATLKVADISNTTYIDIDEDCKIETLNIAPEAKNTKADGKGEIDKINVYASGVDTGKILPAEYYIHKGLTATFAGITYNEGTGKGTLAGFKSAYISGNYYYLNNPTAPGTGELAYEINISVTPTVDGYVYSAAWLASEKALSGKDIYRYCEQNYGGLTKVKAGKTYNIVMVVPKAYSEYNAGIILVTNDGTPLANIVSTAYNQSVISYTPSSMGANPPEVVKADVPEWYITTSDDGESIVIMFDQLMYAYNGRKFVKLSDLNQRDLKQIFALEATPARFASTYPEFDIDVYEGLTTIVYITPDEGLRRGEYYYVYLLNRLYNSQGTQTDTLYDYVYIR